MTFIHCVNVRFFNATAWYGLSLAKLLQTAGHTVYVLTLPNTESDQYAQKMGLHIINFHLTAKNPFTMFAVALRLNRLINTLAPDVITAHRGEFYWCFALKKFFANAKWLLFRVRGDQRPPKANLFNRFLHNNCTDHIVVTTQKLRDYFIKNLRTPANKISIIYGGVDTEKFKFSSSGRSAVRSEFGFSDTDIVIGLVGRYSEVKGHKYLIEALHILRQTDQRYKLLLVTDSADLDIVDLQKIIDQLNLHEHAFITGQRNDIAESISAFDVGVVASIGSEAICRVAFEIMSVGIPLIATDVGALGEIAPNIVPPCDANALAEKISNHLTTIKIFDNTAFINAYLNLCKRVIK